MTDDLTDRRVRVEQLRSVSAGEMQRKLEAAIARHPTDAGRREQPELRQPLSEAELRGSDGYGVAITDVDMTPRPRYGESREKFELRMSRMGVQLETLGREVKQRNRDEALRHVALANGYERWWTVCACGFCGLRVEDPEVARREYDVHVCAAAGVGQAAVDRAIAETDRNVLVKRKAAVLQPAITGPASEEAAADVLLKAPVSAPPLDDFEQRVKLLETK